MMLQETVEFLRQFREASEGTVSVYTCRTFLCKLVENFLTDLDKVASAFQKEGSHIEYFNALHFCGIFLRDKSEVFLPPPSNQSPATPPLHRSDNIIQEDDLTYEFLRWFLSRLLVLLGHQKCVLMHEQTMKTVHELLQAVKSRDAYMYGQIMKEIVTCVIDLVHISDSMFEDKVPITGTWRLDRFIVNMDHVLKSLLEPSQRNKDNEVHLSVADFTVVDIYCCELLQINFTKILCEVSNDNNNFCLESHVNNHKTLERQKKILCEVSSDINNFCLESQVNTLWASLCYQLEIGDVGMKIESLRLLSTLLKNTKIPPEVEEYFKECLTSMIELLSTGLILAENVKQEEKETLEKVTASVINSLFNGNRNSDCQSLLKYFFFKMADIFETNGFSKLQTVDLKTSISFVLCTIQTKLSCDYLVSSVCKSQRSQLIYSMVNEIGFSTDLQYLVAPIVKSIICDLYVKTWNNSDKVTNKVVSETPSTKTALKRKYDGSVRPNIKCQTLSGTYKMIRTKLDDILSQGVQEDVLVKVCGVQTIVEIISSCVQLYSLKDSDAGKHRYASEFSSLGSWLDADGFKEVCGYLYCVLQYLMTSQKRDDDINTCFISCVKIVGAMLALHDNSEYDNDTLQLFGWISSLPWLLNDPSWIDLKPTNSRDIVKIANSLSPKLCHSSLCECLRVLALLPKEVASKWRVHVFRQALCDNILDIKITAVDIFPVLLYHLGPNANHLVYDLLHPSLDEKSIDLHKSLAVISGPLACVVSRKAVLKKSETVSVNKPMYQQYYINCLSCDQSTCANVSGSSVERPKLVDANMFLPFVQLVKSDKTEVKIGLVNSMRLIFGHIGVRKNNTATINILNTALTLIEDCDYDTRTLFSEVIQYLLGKEMNDGSDGTNELVLTKLREAFYRAKSDGHVRQQETVLLTIAQLGRVSEGELLVVVIIVLLESMLSPTPLVAAVAHEQLKDIADFKKTKTQNLFMKCRHDVCKFLVEAMHDAQCGKINKSAEEILIEVSQVLEYSDLKTFLTGIEKFIVPFLVSKGTSAASNLIKLIATQLSVASRSKLLITNTKHVFSYLVRYKPKDSDLQSAINYLQKETKFELRDLLRIDFQRVHNELLIHLSTNYSEVFRGLKILSSCDAQFKGEISTSQEMADYLQPRLLGVLAFFDSQLLKPSIPMEEKRPALESLISIVRLMGSKNISAIRHKVMNTLRIGLQFTDNVFVELSCRAWNCFVRSLELPFLGQMLSQIVATLLPLLKLLPKQVADIFNYMIVENRSVLKDHFHDIYFLPDMPELNEANTVLKQYTDGPSSSQSDFTGQLEHTMKGIQHESLDIRLHALSKLKKLLKEKRKSFLQLVMESESASPLVSKLISVLLKGCREPDQHAQRLYTECLGICGAIDPGRLELSANNPKAELANLQVNIGNDKFAVALINEVVKSYLAATEPRIQDCSAFALQELLSIYNISETEEDGQSKKLWNEFPEHIQEILIPLLSSKYILATDHNWSNLQKPIYGTKKGNTFKDWVSTWTNYLSSKVKTEGQAYKVFKSCSAVINFDIHIAIYILPYVVLHVLQDGSTEEINEVCQEINEVLQQSTRTDGKQKGSINHHMSSQTIFSILDYLTKWKYFMLSMKAIEAAKKKGSSGSSTSSQLDAGYKAVCQFLERIPQDKLSQVSFSCKAYTRALMHFELHLWDKTNLSKEELDFMQRIYVELDESDGVQGVAAIRQSSPSLQEQILTFSGRIGCQIELQTCYEQAIQCEPDEFSHHQGLLRCLMDLGQPSQALHHATGVIADRKPWASQLLPFQIEAAWKLGSWTALENYTKVDKTSRSWPVMLGRVLLSAKAKDEEDFLHQLQIVRQEQVGPLSAASFEMGSYQRGYEYIVRLHLLNEIEETMQIFLRQDKQDKTARQHLLSLWQTSLKMMQSSFKVQEPVLTMRRTLMTLTQQEGHCDLDLDREIGHSWLSSAKIAHKTGYLQTAYSFLLQASEFNLPEFCLQKAKWHWEKGEYDQALSLLEREMSHHFNDISALKADTSPTGTAKRKVYAKARLLYGRFCEETSKIESNAIVKQYKEVIDIAHDWEDGWFYLGKYFDKIMTALVDDKDDITKQGEFMIHVVKNLGTSLYYGNQFIYQSLPRLLSLWLDYGTSVVEQEKKMKGSLTSSASYQKNKSNLAKLNTMIGTFGKNLAPYQLFFTFSQLTSRICHAHPDVFAQLKAIIARLVVSYPRQALWLLMAVSKSSYQMRAKRCQEIFATARDMDSSLTKVIQDYIKLTERLLELCEKDITGSIASIDKNFRPLKRLLDDKSFTKILLPLQSSMTVTLPNMVDKRVEYNPFPGDIIYIHGFEDTIEVLPSLQKPKKITLKGSDGKLYVMMCKPKDDLRKDCRLMEFNGIVNKFLRKDPESRKRYLYIRTYTVIPLNEECGLIEWVNNTSGLRHILVKLYKEKNLYTSGSELKSMMPTLQSPRETKLQVFKQKLLPRHPPVFGEWFLRTFPDPTSWYNARLAYCKTVAVMSMVGYILGLGDRHGENILFDSTSGDCIHVDLNCLFNRGETFEWPEKVPFRLTHNLIHAMGPLKLEGIFRRACEVTLRVMRKESEPLMSMLKPFVYDPLVEWSKPSRGHRQSSTESGEITNEQGRSHVQNIEQRLQGILNRGTKRSGLALSVEGHVNHLIREATDDNNLCQMYIGWAAYL